VQYSERLTVPLRWWVQGTMLIATLWLAVAVAAPPLAAAVVALAAMALLTTCFVSYGGVRVIVRNDEFRAGRAHITTSLVGAVAPLDADATRRAAGVDADARAFLLLRPYLKRSVRVEITDPADPAPYWLVSTRHPDELAAALQSATDPGMPKPTAG
jgi:hypothetical protein